MKIPAAKAAVDKEWETLEKISAWDKAKVRSKKEVIDDARTKGAKVHFASLMDICHLKNAELEAKHPKYKGRVVLRGDTVKDDSGSSAVFTEQGSSASQMTAAKVMGIHIQIARVRRTSSWCSIWLNAPKLLKIPKSDVQTFGFVYHDTNGQNHGPVWKTQSFLLSEICTVIPWQDCCRKGNLRKSYWNMDGRRFPSGNACSYAVKKGYSYLCMWMTSKLAGKRQNIDPMWKVLHKEVDLGEPTFFLDNVYLGCTQRQCEISKDMWTITEPCLNHEFPRGELKNFHALRIFVFLHGLMIWKVMRRNVWSDIVSKQTRRLNNSTKYLLHASMTTTSKKKWNL